METLCRLCAKVKSPKQLAYNITDQALNIEQKLIDCCRWNLFIPSDELTKKVCRACFKKLENSWMFAETVRLAQEQFFAYITDIKPELPIIDCTNVSIESDNANEHLEDIKVFSSPLDYIPNFENDSALAHDSTAFNSNSSTSSEEDSSESSEESESSDDKKSPTEDVKKRYSRQLMLRYFKEANSAAATFRLISEAYGESAPSLPTCESWFRRFRRGNFNLADKIRPGRPRLFEDIELQVLVDEDPTRSLSELANILGVSNRPVFRRLRGLGMGHKDGKWVINKSVKNSVDGEAQNASLQVHSKDKRKEILAKIHSRKPIEPRCICDTCGKELSRPELLKRHSMIHLTKPPFLCKSCGKAFRTNFNLEVNNFVNESIHRRFQY